MKRRNTPRAAGGSGRVRVAGLACRARNVDDGMRRFPSGRTAESFINARISMRTSLVAAGLAAAALLISPAAASADPDPVTAFVQGLASGFGSSSGGQSAPRQQNYLYPDGPSCYQDATRIRRPGVTAECNPVGGASGQYQLMVIGR